MSSAQRRTRRPPTTSNLLSPREAPFGGMKSSRATRKIIGYLIIVQPLLIESWGWGRGRGWGRGCCSTSRRWEWPNCFFLPLFVDRVIFRVLCVHLVKLAPKVLSRWPWAQRRLSKVGQCGQWFHLKVQRFGVQFPFPLVGIGKKKSYIEVAWWALSYRLIFCPMYDTSDTPWLVARYNLVNLQKKILEVKCTNLLDQSYLLAIIFWIEDNLVRASAPVLVVYASLYLSMCIR